MDKNDRIKAHDREAHIYDRQALEYEYYTYDALFGMCYEFITPGERLLDLGIGTGLASLPFARAGLEIHGLDGSAEMLKVCEAKKFTKELKCFDLSKTPLPYSDDFFSHVICSGVLHFFDDLKPIFKDVARIMRKKGIFAFTVAMPPADATQIVKNCGNDCVEMDTVWGVSIFAHGYSYMSAIMHEHGFETLKRQRIILPGGPDIQEDLIFAIFVTRKRSDVTSLP